MTRLIAWIACRPANGGGTARHALPMVLGLVLNGCAMFGGNGGGYPGGYGYPGYGSPGGYGYPAGYGYYPPRNYPPPPPRYQAPPMSPEQQQLKYLYDHREAIQKLPPEQQKEVLRRAKKMLENH